MANTRNGNTIYLDSTGAASTAATSVAGIYVTPTASDCRLVLRDNSGSTQNKTDIRIADGNTLFFDHSGNPLYFPGGINVATLTSCIATAVLKGQG